MNTRSRRAEEQKLIEGISDIFTEEPEFFNDLIVQGQLVIWLNMKMGKNIRAISDILAKPKDNYTRRP